TGSGIIPGAGSGNLERWLQCIPESDLLRVFPWCGDRASRGCGPHSPATSSSQNLTQILECLLIRKVSTVLGFFFRVEPIPERIPRIFGVRIELVLVQRGSETLDNKPEPFSGFLDPVIVPLNDVHVLLVDGEFADVVNACAWPPDEHERVSVETAPDLWVGRGTCNVCAIAVSEHTVVRRLGALVCGTQTLLEGCEACGAARRIPISEGRGIVTHPDDRCMITVRITLVHMGIDFLSSFNRGLQSTHVVEHPGNHGGNVVCQVRVTCGDGRLASAGGRGIVEDQELVIVSFDALKNRLHVCELERIAHDTG